MALPIDDFMRKVVRSERTGIIGGIKVAADEQAGIAWGRLTEALGANMIRAPRKLRGKEVYDLNFVGKDAGLDDYNDIRAAAGYHNPRQQIRGRGKQLFRRFLPGSSKANPHPVKVTLDQAMHNYASVRGLTNSQSSPVSEAIGREILGYKYLEEQAKMPLRSQVTGGLERDYRFTDEYSNILMYKDDTDAAANLLERYPQDMTERMYSSKIETLRGKIQGTQDPKRKAALTKQFEQMQMDAQYELTGGLPDFNQTRAAEAQRKANRDMKNMMRSGRESSARSGMAIRSSAPELP